MTRFEDMLVVSPNDDGKNWVVMEAFYYDTEVWLRGMPHDQVICQAGFQTDFTSIPWFLWGILGAPAEGRYRRAAVIHDKLYRTCGLATRRQADAVLWEAMTVCRTPRWTQCAIYLGVRLGGHRSYRGGL